MKFLGISFNISELMNKMIVSHSCSCDVIPLSSAYQDGGLRIKSFLTLNANILGTTSDIKKRPTTLFPILSDLTFEINMLFG